MAGKVFTSNRAGNAYFRRENSLLSVFEEFVFILLCVPPCLWDLFVVRV